MPQFGLVTRQELKGPHQSFNRHARGGVTLITVRMFPPTTHWIYQHLHYRISAITETPRMPEFFRGWRRKTGSVTLAMAVVMSSMWLRTFLSDDYVAFWFSPHRTQLIYSSNETLCWCAWDAKYPIPQWYWDSRTDRRTSNDVDRPPSKFIRKAHYDSNNLRYPHVNYRRWWLSFRIAVPALTLVSVYLLMTKSPQHVIRDAAFDRNRSSSTSNDGGQ